MHVSTFQRAWVLEYYELLAERVYMSAYMDIGYVLRATQDIPWISIFIIPRSIDFSRRNKFDIFDIREMPLHNSQVLIYYIFTS